MPQLPYNRPSPGASGLKPAGHQEPRVKVGQYPMPGAAKTKIQPYPARSTFAGRPLSGRGGHPHRRGRGK